MNIDILKGKKHIHFIGIGGSGMYPLAQILHTKGYYLTGSDNNETETLQAVRDMGIPVYLGQRAENIEGADLIVHTAAIMADNPELIAAKASGVPVLERSELLGIVTSWYDNAICVAGTHGKTTTTSMVTQILFTAGVDLSAFIGGKLPCIHGSGRSGSSDIMTCEACEFVDTFLKLYPDIAVLLNIDADHLDYFGTMEKYFETKKRFFIEGSALNAALNADDETSASIIRDLKVPYLTYGISAEADVFARDIEISEEGVSFSIRLRGLEDMSISMHLTGMFNVYNALAAASLAMIMGIDKSAIREGLESVKNVPGRVEILDTRTPYKVILDYAHSPDALENVLTTVRAFTRSRLIVLFGCGGDRDHGKRPIMGEIVGRLADFSILTSDNPRTEDPQAILRSIEEGMKRTQGRYVVIENRREAIRYALEMGREGDVIILAGKGNETYQDIMGVKRPFDEKVVVRELLAEMRA